MHGDYKSTDGNSSTMRKSQETRPFLPDRKHSDSYMEIQDGVHYSSLDSRIRLARQRRTRRCALVFVVILFIAILGGLLYYYFSRKVKEYEIAEETQSNIVELKSGFVRGIFENDAVVFKGIPYALAPEGDLRWKAPLACKMNNCWRGTFEASEFGTMCAQQDVLNKTDPTTVIGTEDCLFINVWTPKKRPSEKLLPVLVYIHGGYLLYSSGNWNGLCPSAELVTEINVVGVSFNYRLNAFGFLALKSLADAPHSITSGNYGFMDQILALKWVKENIEKFGGNPASVTLIGQSSGATSLLALLAAPAAKGLFHRAILMSGSPIFNKSSEDAARDNEIFVKKSNCVRNNSSAERECLYSLTPKEIEDAIPWDVYPYWRMTDQNDLPTKNMFDGAVAVVDKVVVPHPPLVAIATGRASDVPLIIGTTAQETNFQPVKNFENSTWADYSAYVKEKLFPFIGDNVSEVLSMYNKSVSEGSALQFFYTSMVSDVRVTCPNNVLTHSASTFFKSPVYCYVVTNSPSAPINLIGFPATLACHMWDLVAFFGFPKDFQYFPSEKDLSFMRDLRTEFSKFIHNKPFTSWGKYPQNTSVFTDGGEKILGRDGYHKKECDFWLDNGFFPYAWIN